MRYLIIAIQAVLVLVSCSDNTKIIYSSSPDNELDEKAITVEVKKWKDNHTAALSITYDHGWGTGGSLPTARISQDMVLERGLVLDYELVTATAEPWPLWVQAELRDTQMPLGIHFFGHGHYHSAHDTLSFIECLDSFRTCFMYMKVWDLNPKAYAYPHGSGRTPSTQLACQLAGFICARGFDPPSEDMYICPSTVTEPENWYLLPCARASSKHSSSKYITSHDEMATVLEKTVQKTAWIILCYHSIGFPDGWGYYPFDDFEQDLDTIVEHDFWCSNMDVIACYIKERSNFTFEMEALNSADNGVVYEVIFSDGLPNSIYDTPLTIDFTFHENLSVKKVVFNPSLNGSNEYSVTSNRLRLNVIPDERQYLMILRH